MLSSAVFPRNAPTILAITLLPNRCGLVIQKKRSSVPIAGMSSLSNADLSTKYYPAAVVLYASNGILLFKNIPIGGFSFLRGKWNLAITVTSYHVFLLVSINTPMTRRPISLAEYLREWGTFLTRPCIRSFARVRLIRFISVVCHAGSIHPIDVRMS